MIEERYSLLGKSNLENLAKTLKLPIIFLEELGVRYWKKSHFGSLVIPYLDEDCCLLDDGLVDGNKLFLRERTRQGYRQINDGPAIPYGLWRMERICHLGWVLLAKDELDCWVLWYHGIPSLSLPHCIDWSGEWRTHLVGIEVFLWNEDAVEDMDRAVEVFPELKIMAGSSVLGDLLAAHLQGQDLFILINDLKAQAVPLMACLEEAQPFHIRDLCA